MKKLALLALLFIGLSTTSQINKTFFLGHSLVNFHMPNMVNKLSIAGSNVYSYSVNVGNGANLLYHWNNPTSGQGNQWNTTLPLGGFENFIVTEAVPLLGHLQWSNTYRIADSLYHFAKLQNPNIQYYIYETWHCTNSGNGSTSGAGGYPCDWDPQSTTLWRQRLTIDLPKWESIADSINLIHTNDMLIIPAGRALAQLYDSIVANKVPGITSMNQLFSDNIHLTNAGNYFIACVMYGVIHKISPVGLPNQLTDEWGVPYTVFPTATQAAVFQRIAWKTLCGYPRDGVNCLTTNINELNTDTFKIIPNPTQNIFEVPSNSPLNIRIVSTNGSIIYENENYFKEKINIEKNGVYFIRIIDENKNTINKKIIITN